jgi:peptide methionine sulfoxide reductase MsrA
MGGDVDDPTYAEVTGHGSGHLETVRVYFDPERVSYEVIVKRFFEIHDPTQSIAKTIPTAINIAVRYRMLSVPVVA